MKNYEYIPVDSELNFDEEYDFVTDLVYRDVDQLQRKSGINITSDKELNYVVLNENQDSIIAASWISHCPSDNSFSFDVIVSEEYQRNGIGKQLTENCMSIFDEYKDMYDDLNLDIRVVNKHMKSILDKYELDTTELNPDDWIMSKKTKEKVSKLKKGI